MLGKMKTYYVLSYTRKNLKRLRLVTDPRTRFEVWNEAKKRFFTETIKDVWEKRKK